VFRRLGLVIVVEVIRSQAPESHVRAPHTVPILELGTQGREVVKAFDERDAAEPFILERLDDPLGDSDGPVFAYGRHEV
jgi:hypothetical protein